MIFDKGYDRALWLILAIDKDNREKIIELIKGIPKELYVKLLDVLKKYQDYEHMSLEMRKKFCFYGEIEDEKKDLYSFHLDTERGLLNLGKHVLTDNQYYFNEIEISLFPCNKDDLKMFDSQLLGEVLANSKKINELEVVTLWDYTQISYDYKKMPFGSILVMHNKDLPVVKKRVRRINTRKIPEDYSISDLDKTSF